MKLPGIKISIPFIFLCWCLVGVQVHGLVILAYPAMWAVVGLFFFGLHLLIKAPANPSATETASGTSTGQTNSAAVPDDSPTDHQISASV